MTWHLIWAAWILFCIASFGILEGMALTRQGGVSLSQSMYDATQVWPLLPVLFGIVMGGLTVHFWWHWIPSESLPKLKAMFKR